MIYQIRNIRYCLMIIIQMHTQIHYIVKKIDILVQPIIQKNACTKNL